MSCAILCNFKFKRSALLVAVIVLLSVLLAACSQSERAQINGEVSAENKNISTPNAALARALLHAR
jgi:thioredoxin-related protein